MRPPRRTKAVPAHAFTDITGASPRSPPKTHPVAYRLAHRGDEPHRGGLVVDHADGALVGDDAGDRLGGRVARQRDHVEADGADRGHRLELLQRERAGLGGADHALVLPDGDERARQAARRRGAMAPPFFTASFSSASAAVVPGAPARTTPIASRMSATESPSAGVGRERQVDDAELHARAGVRPRERPARPRA